MSGLLPNFLSGRWTAGASTGTSLVDPVRAGGGEELGGPRALNFYHRRAAVQASTTVLSALGTART